jgi:hypothetical protein
MSKNSLKGVTEVQTEFVKQAASVLPFIIKTGIILGVGYYVYYRFTNRFTKMAEKTNYPTSNVTAAQAEARANAIAGSIGWVSNDLDNVTNQLTGLNYNGFIRVYNAFGHHKGTLLAGDLNLIEWLQNQFPDDIEQLSFLTNGAFF